MYCDTRRQGTCVRAWWLHNSRATFVVAASHPTPARRQFHHSDFVQWPGTNWNVTSGQTVSSAKYTCIIGGRRRNAATTVTVVDMHTGAHTACRETWLIKGQWLFTSLCLIQQETTVFVCPPSACRRSQRFKQDLWKKQTSLLSVIIPLCYAIIKHLLILPLALPVCIIIICEPDTFSMWECKNLCRAQQRCRLHNNHNLKSIPFSGQCTKSSVYITGLERVVIWLRGLSPEMLILSKGERWEVDFGLL